MAQSPGAQAPYEPAPLSADEKARAELTFVPYVAELLTTRGRFRTSVDRPEMVELFQRAGLGWVTADPVALTGVRICTNMQETYL